MISAPGGSRRFQACVIYIGLGHPLYRSPAIYLASMVNSGSGSGLGGSVPDPKISPDIRPDPDPDPDPVHH